MLVVLGACSLPATLAVLLSNPLADKATLTVIVIVLFSLTARSPRLQVTLPLDSVQPDVAEKSVTLDGSVSVEVADLIPDGWRYWLTSDQVSDERQGVQSDDEEMLRVDAGRNLGIARVLARQKS